MLTEIKLSNFRRFDDEVTIRVRPITILIGRNSTGKSSIIKFLLMLQQSLGSTSSDFLVAEGERVHLGAFRELRNSRSARKRLEFQLSFTTNATHARSHQEFIKAFNPKALLSSLSKKGPKQVSFHFPDLSTPAKVREEKVLNTISASVSYGNRQIGHHEARAAIGDESLADMRSKELSQTRFLRFMPRQSKPLSMLEEMLSAQFISPVEEEIRRMRHISPIREESQRAIVVASPPRDDVGQRGEYSMPHLQRILEAGGTPAALVMRHLEAVAGVKRIKFKKTMKSYLAHCRAVSSDTNAEAYIADFGFGVSQCLPLFIQGALCHKEQLLMVEQPEAQLHPTAQLELGSFFAELWAQRGVPSIVETHSSALILRLRKLMAGKKPILKPEDVSIAYFHVNTKRMPVVKNLGIDRDGAIEPGLPMEFFGADVLEAMQIGS